MREMYIEHRGRKERVIYIEYHGNIPHSAITEHNGWCTYWDFMIFNGDRKDLRHYNAGSGGSIMKIQAPHYVDGCKDTYYWMHSDAKYNGRPQNITKINRPKIVKGWTGASINPFKVSDEIHSYTYCEKCNANYSDPCDEHQYWDSKEGVVRYNDGTLAE